jgi:ArsR family transcriptional regulator, arsenate/arsenite/antimonite-responsive transcriptional repressor
MYVNIDQRRSRKVMMAKTLTMATLQMSACCGGALDSVLPRKDADELSIVLKAVADPVRLQLLSIIRAAAAHEACVCDLTVAVQLSQPTVSHHLKVLTDAGLLTRERRGSWAWFSLVPSRLSDIASIFT